MTTLQFNCPQCGQVCAFDSKYIGRRIRCTKCSARFLIPADGQPARIIKQPTFADGPYSGFWKALLRSTPKTLFQAHGFMAAIFMVFTFVLRFFYGHPFFVVYVPFFFSQVPIPIGVFVLAITTGFQCRYFLEMIQSMCDQEDILPWVLEGASQDRLFQAIIATYNLLILTAANLAPAGLVWFILKKAGIQTLWRVMAVAAVGLFFLPLSLTVYAYSRDVFISFRLDCVLRAARKAFWPHMALYLQFLAIAALFWHSPFFAKDAPIESIKQGVLFHTIIAVLSIPAARTAGLFYRHYGCYLP